MINLPLHRAFRSVLSGVSARTAPSWRGGHIRASVALVALVLAFLGAGLPLAGQDGVGPAAAVIPSLTDLQERFRRLYPCPGEGGLATFAALVVSDQVNYTAKALQVPIPAMGIRYLGREGFEVHFDRDSLLKIENGSLVLDVADAIKNAAEGFFQAYETLAFRNLLIGLPATPTISLSSDTTIVEYPDRTPGQAVRLTFDPDLRLLALEARDDAQHARNLMIPRWVQVGQKFVLVSVEIEFFQNGSSNFRTLFKIENEPVKGLFLPSRVTMHARDGGMESVKNALIDFQMTDYSLGFSQP